MSEATDRDAPGDKTIETLRQHLASARRLRDRARRRGDREAAAREEALIAVDERALRARASGSRRGTAGRVASSRCLPPRPFLATLNP